MQLHCGFFLELRVKRESKMRPTSIRKALMVCSARRVPQEPVPIMSCIASKSRVHAVEHLWKNSFDAPAFLFPRRRVFFSSFAWCCALELGLRGMLFYVRKESFIPIQSPSTGFASPFSDELAICTSSRRLLFVSVNVDLYLRWPGLTLSCLSPLLLSFVRHKAIFTINLEIRAFACSFAQNL